MARSVVALSNGNMQLAAGRLQEALECYRDSRAILEKLVKADPGNTGAQRDLSICYDKMGGVFQEQGHLQEALRSYRDSFLIREKLAKADPRNNEAQRDLFVSDESVGDVLKAQGHLEEACNGTAMVSRSLSS